MLTTPCRAAASAAGEPRTGVPWLDEPGVDEVLVRWSKVVGLPPGLPDVQGLAVRVPFADGTSATATRTCSSPPRGRAG